MELLEALKAAKAFLNVVDHDPDYKTDYICFAIHDAFVAKYGVGRIYSDSKTYSESKTGLQLRKAREFIGKRLWELQAVHRLPFTDSFSHELAVRYLGEEKADLQVARHLWLDSLIKELEDAESN